MHRECSATVVALYLGARDQSYNIQRKHSQCMCVSDDSDIRSDRYSHHCQGYYEYLLWSSLVSYNAIHTNIFRTVLPNDQRNYSNTNRANCEQQSSHHKYKKV